MQRGEVKLEEGIEMALSLRTRKDWFVCLFDKINRRHSTTE